MPPTLILMFGSTLWGLTWLWLKHIDALGLDPITTAIVAYGAQFLVVLPIVIRSLYRHPVPMDRRTVLWLGLLATVGGISGIAFTLAIMYGNVVRSMMLFFLIPAWGVLFGNWFLGERITLMRLIAVVLALGGAAVILGPDAITTAPLRITDFAALLAGITLAAANVLFLYLSDRSFGVKLVTMQAGTLVFGALALLFVTGMPEQIPMKGVFSAIGYGTTMLLLAMLAAQYAIERLPAGRAAILMTLELLVAVVSAIVIGHERPLPHVWVGGVLILMAALLEAVSHNTQTLREAT